MNQILMFYNDKLLECINSLDKFGSYAYPNLSIEFNFPQYKTFQENVVWPCVNIPESYIIEQKELINQTMHRNITDRRKQIRHLHLLNTKL